MRMQMDPVPLVFYLWLFISGLPLTSIDSFIVVWNPWLSLIPADTGLPVSFSFVDLLLLVFLLQSQLDALHKERGERIQNDPVLLVFCL